MILSTLHITGTSNCSIFYIFSGTLPHPFPYGEEPGERLVLNFCCLIYQIKNADIHRAGDGATTASYAQVLAEALLVINKLV